MRMLKLLYVCYDTYKCYVLMTFLMLHSVVCMDGAVLILTHTTKYEYKLYLVCTDHTLYCMYVGFINKDLGPQLLVLVQLMVLASDGVLPPPYFDALFCLSHAPHYSCGHQCKSQVGGKKL